MHVEEYIEDIYTCNRTRCGFCREECPVYNEFRFEAYSCRGRMLIIRGLIEGKIKMSKELLDCVNLCATCGYCRYKCALHNVDIIEALRADLVEHGITDKYHDVVRAHVLKTGNPMGLPAEDKSKWAEGLEFDDNSDKLFYTGCVYPYLYPERLRTIVNVFNKLNIKLKYLGNKESCCGNILYTTGYWKDFDEIAQKNINVLSKSEVKQIITPCPGCAKILKLIYQERFGDYGINIMHVIEFLDKLISEGKINFIKSVNMKITWHDPCDLSRHLRIIEEPRRILNKIPGIEFIEMEHNKYESKCCGAGGGMLNACTDVTMDIAEKRLREAEKTGAEYIITSCPTCESTFERIIRYEDSEMKIMDLFELIEKAL